MSEYMFGVIKKKIGIRDSKKLDKICREEGGYGFSQIDDSHGTARGGRWIGWFSGPNLGSPFDGDMGRAVVARATAEVPAYALARAAEVR